MDLKKQIPRNNPHISINSDLNLTNPETIKSITEIAYQKFKDVAGIKCYRFAISGDDKLSSMIYSKLKNKAKENKNPELDQRLINIKYLRLKDEEIGIMPEKKLYLDYVIHLSSILENSKKYFRDSNEAIFNKDGYIANIRKMGGRIDHIIAFSADPETIKTLENTVHIHSLYQQKKIKPKYSIN